MIKKVKGHQFKVLKIISTVAVTIATHALITQSPCTLSVYEPKMPKALKKELNK